MSTIKTIIEEHQRGLLYRDGRLVKWLEPGPHRYWGWRAQWRVDVLDLAPGYSESTPELRAILPESQGYEVSVKEHEVGVLTLDGKPTRVLETGRYILWQQRRDVRLVIYDMRELVATVPDQHAALIPSHLLATYTVAESQRGVVTQDACVVSWLEPGRHRIWQHDRQVGMTYLNIQAGFLAMDHMPEIAGVLPQKAAEPLEVSVGEVAILYREGRGFASLGPGSYMIWQLRHKIRAKVFSTQEIMTQIPQEDWSLVGAHMLIQQTVRPHERGLLWVDGEFSGELGEGRYGVHNDRRDVTFTVVDMREQELQIPGQEVMTRDKVTLRLNLVVKWAVTDARRSVEAQTALRDAIYSEAQLVARGYIASASLDELLEARHEAAEAMLADLAPRARAWGVEVARIDLKDVILPGEMKTLLNRVIEAEKQAAANVILRREETSATRAQANTAKMMENNPALMRLKELELVSEIAHNVGNITIVAGGDDLMKALTSRSLPTSGDR